MSTAELACSYAAMILQDDGMSITAEKIGALVKSANVSVESCWLGLFARLAEKRNLEDLFLNACATGGSPPVAVPPSAAGAGGATSAAAQLCQGDDFRLLILCPLLRLRLPLPRAVALALAMT
ncbi:hypothetical protein ACFX15_041443 [Malus domestica]